MRKTLYAVLVPVALAAAARLPLQAAPAAPPDGKVLAGHSDEVRAVSFSPDGKLLASGSHDRTVRLWDTQTGALKRALSGHALAVTSLAFSPDGKLLASGSADKSVRLWDARAADPK